MKTTKGEPECMRVSLLLEREANDFLADGASRRAWCELHERCPWSTVFQGWEFAAAWYEQYRQHYYPLMARSISPSGLMRGLLCLARHRKTGHLIPVGGRDAEYQGWIALPEDSNEFPREALKELNHRLPGIDMVFRYLPAGTPMTWLNSLRHGPFCDVEVWSRPVMRAAKASDSLRKKSNRSRISRLKSQGELRFDRIRDPAALERIIGDVALMYDLRQGAQHGTFPFRRDPEKGQLLVRLLRDGVLHATALWCGETLVSVHLGAAGDHEVHLGVIAHSPFYARHSPGKIHLLLLAQMLVDEGYVALDLTAGGDPYKDRFADHHDEVHLMHVYGSRRRQLVSHVLRGIESSAREVLRVTHVQPKTVKAAYRRFRRTKPWRVPLVLLRNVRDRLIRDSEYRIYSVISAGVDLNPPKIPVSRDSLADLLRYVPAEGWQSEQGFLARALPRLENGEHIYTVSEGDQLLHYGWLQEQADSTFATEVQQELQFPARSAYLYDFYTFPNVRGRKLYQQSLRQIIADLAENTEVDRTFIGVLADNGPSRHVIEKAGFKYEFSAFQHIRFGRIRRWVTGQMPASSTTRNGNDG
jgi:CelD/BcsL family acetyltransferase involved in cellulose biosynthesis